MGTVKSGNSVFTTAKFLTNFKVFVDRILSLYVPVSMAAHKAEDERYDKDYQEDVKENFSD